MARHSNEAVPTEIVKYVPRQSSYDFFIPEAEPICNEEDRNFYEKFIGFKLIPLLRKHQLSFSYFKDDGCAIGDRISNIRQCKSHCKMTIVVLCEAIATKSYLSDLGFSRENMIFLDIGCDRKSFGNLLSDLTTIRFVTQNDITSAMKRIASASPSSATVQWHLLESLFE